MKFVWLLVRQEMRIILSDKKSLALLFLMPSLLIVFLSLALKDVYQQKVGQNVKVVFLTDNSTLSKGVIEQFAEFKYNTSTQTKHQGLLNYIDKNKTQVAIEIPADIADLIKGKGAKEKIKMYFDPALDKAYTELIKSHFLIAMQSMVIDQVNRKLKQQNEESGTPSIQVNKLALAKDLVDEVGEKEIIPNPIQQTVPAWALFAMFFIALPMSSSFIRDRESGVLKRLLCYNIGKPTLLIGKIIPYILINNLQFYLMFFLGLFVVPRLIQADFELGDFNLTLLLLVSLVCSLAATSYGLLISTLARSNEQASSLGALLVVIMALFGGVMIPHFVMPSFMQKVSVISPLYWGLESYFDIFLRNSSFFEISQRLGVLLLFSLFAFILSVQKFMWSSK